MLKCVKTKKLPWSEKLFKTLFCFLCLVSARISAFSEHTPGPDTRSSPEGLTGEGRKGGLKMVLRAMVVSAKIERRIFPYKL
jgi:hypothetical protein